MRAIMFFLLLLAGAANAAAGAVCLALEHSGQGVVHLAFALVLTGGSVAAVRAGD